MVDNETMWDIAREIAEIIDKLTYAIEQQNRILQRILEALCAK
jgi:hypothetical protein